MTLMTHKRQKTKITHRTQKDIDCTEDTHGTEVKNDTKDTHDTDDTRGIENTHDTDDTDDTHNTQDT